MLSSEGYDVKNVFTVVSGVGDYSINYARKHCNPGLEGFPGLLWGWPSQAVFPKSFTPIAFDTLPISGSLSLFPKQRAAGDPAGLGIQLLPP